LSTQANGDALIKRSVFFVIHMKKYIKYISIALFYFLAVTYVFAVQITVPSAPSSGYFLVSTTTGAYIATTTITTTGCLTVDSPTLVVDCVNHRVGVGITNPAVILEASKASGNDATIQVDTKGVGSAGAYFAADSVTNGFYGLKLLNSGTERWFIGDFTGQLGLSFVPGASPSGNPAMIMTSGSIIGIGTSTPNANNKLEVVSTDSGTTNTLFPTTISHISSATPAANFGVGYQFRLKRSDGADSSAGYISTQWSNPTASSESADMIFAPMRSSSGNGTEAMRILGVNGLFPLLLEVVSCFVLQAI